MAMPSSTITRYELGATFNEFDLAMSRKKFIGPKVLRPVMVGVQAADVGKIPIEALLLTRKDDRAPGAGYRRGDFEFSKYSYATDEHGWEETLDDRKLAIYRDILNAEQIHAQRAMDFVMRNYEIAVAAAVYNTTTWTGAALTTDITHEWDDHTNAVPVDNIEAARLKVIEGCGMEPNALICNRKQAFHLGQCANIVDRIKYSGKDDPKKIPLAALAECLQVDMIIVAGGYKNTAKEGQDVSISTVWGDENMMLAKVATGDDPQEPCIGRTFMWSGDGPGAPGSDEEIAVVVEEYREEARRGGIIRARNDRDLVIMYPQCGHLIGNAIEI